MSEKRIIQIFRASPGTLEGRIDNLGRHLREVRTERLGTRIKSTFGNGTRSDVIDRTYKEVEVVNIGVRSYVLQAGDKVTIDPHEAFVATGVSPLAALRDLVGQVESSGVEAPVGEAGVDLTVAREVLSEKEG